MVSTSLQEHLNNNWSCTSFLEPNGTNKFTKLYQMEHYKVIPKLTTITSQLSRKCFITSTILQNITDEQNSPITKFDQQSHHYKVLHHQQHYYFNNISLQHHL
jgi:hypothetical protein